MAGMLSLDWLFALGGCDTDDRKGDQGSEFDEDSGFAGFSARRNSLGSQAVMSAQSSASAVREPDHFRDARHDLRKHVLKMEELSDQLRLLGQVRERPIQRRSCSYS